MGSPLADPIADPPTPPRSKPWSGTNSATIVGRAVTSSFGCAWQDSPAIVRLRSIGGTANGEGARQDS